MGGIIVTLEPHEACIAIEAFQSHIDYLERQLDHGTFPSPYVESEEEDMAADLAEVCELLRKIRKQLGYSPEEAGEGLEGK
jgi:hypothetical protein